MKLTHSFTLSISGQVNNATARVMTNKKPGNPYANGENPACFRDQSRSLGKLRQPKAPTWCPSFPASVLSERSGHHPPHPHSWCLQSELLSVPTVQCPQLPEAV